MWKIWLSYSESFRYELSTLSGKVQSSVTCINKSLSLKFTDPKVVSKRELRMSLYNWHFKRKCSSVSISFKLQKMQRLSFSGSPRNRPSLHAKGEYPTSKFRHSGCNGVFFWGGGLECPLIVHSFQWRCVVLLVSKFQILQSFRDLIAMCLLI